jgi:hypothetical protein
MKRMKLKVEALQVESFVPESGTRGPRGTVHANEFEPFNRDIPHDDSNALACATGGYNYCAADTYGCVEVTTGCYYEITSLC